MCELFASEVVFIKMPSRQEKKRAKRRATYLENRDEVLRASYNANPEKKKAAVSERYQADPEKKKAGVKKIKETTINKNILSEKVGGI